MHAKSLTFCYSVCEFGQKRNDSRVYQKLVPAPRLCHDSQSASVFFLIDASVCLHSPRTVKTPHCLLKSLAFSLVLEPIWKRIYTSPANLNRTPHILLSRSERFMQLSVPCHS